MAQAITEHRQECLSPRTARLLLVTKQKLVTRAWPFRPLDPLGGSSAASRCVDVVLVGSYFSIPHHNAQPPPPGNCNPLGCTSGAAQTEQTLAAVCQMVPLCVSLLHCVTCVFMLCVHASGIHWLPASPPLATAWRERASLATRRPAPAEVRVGSGRLVYWLLLKHACWQALAAILTILSSLFLASHSIDSDINHVYSSAY